MNTVRAGTVGVDSFELFQVPGSLDSVVAVVGEYPETRTGERRFDQFIAHLVADPQAQVGQLAADGYQFPAEVPGGESYRIVGSLRGEHEGRTRYRDCTSRCDHAPLPSLYPNLNWTFDKGHSSYDRRRAEFGRTSEPDAAPWAPDDAAPRPGYEAALGRLGVMVSEAKSLGLRAPRAVVSATDPLTLPPLRFSDQRVGEQQAMIDRCMAVCRELAGHADLELRDVGSMRRFVGPTGALQHYHFQDHVIPKW